jgi:hypothetical protein
MKNQLFFLFLFVCFIPFFQCKQATENTSEPAVSREFSPDRMRDIPGLSAKRGLISKTNDATPGFILFHPSAGTSTYLMDLDGKIVHEWKGENNCMLSYLMDDGRIIRLEREPNFPVFAGGGQAGRIREYSWEGELTWDYPYYSEKYLTHHDIAIMPNGHILAIAWEVKTKAECIAAGCIADQIPEAGLWFDKIMEIEPQRPNGGKIVWEWHMWDHIIQDQNADLPNFGVVKDNPRRINVNPHIHAAHMPAEQIKQMIAGGMATSNATPENQGSDLTHLNGMDYNADLDQIAVSSQSFSEIFVIDHSTTTEEAMSSSGGRWGHGGDVLFRWGNPQNYGKGGPQDQRLFNQHDIRWIPQGYPGAGNLMAFSNEVIGGKGQFPNVFAALGTLQRPVLSLAELDNYSAVVEFKPDIDANGAYLLPEGGRFGPDNTVWTYTAPDKYSFYGPFVSSAHRMKNGNTFINSGPQGRQIEVTPDGRTVWEYWNPYFQDYRLPDGTVPQPVGPFMFAQFRTSHIMADHPALAGRTLRPLSKQPEVFVVPPPPQEKKM